MIEFYLLFIEFNLLITHNLRNKQFRLLQYEDRCLHIQGQSFQPQLTLPHPII